MFNKKDKCHRGYYKLLKYDAIAHEGEVLYRIQATKSFDVGDAQSGVHHIKRGELGGYICCDTTLTKNGWVDSESVAIKSVIVGAYIMSSEIINSTVIDYDLNACKVHVSNITTMSVGFHFSSTNSTFIDCEIVDSKINNSILADTNLCNTYVSEHSEISDSELTDCSVWESTISKAYISDEIDLTNADIQSASDFIVINSLSTDDIDKVVFFIAKNGNILVNNGMGKSPSSIYELPENFKMCDVDTTNTIIATCKKILEGKLHQRNLEKLK